MKVRIAVVPLPLVVEKSEVGPPNPCVQRRAKRVRCNALLGGRARTAASTVTSVWPCASAASSPASPAVVSSPRTRLGRYRWVVERTLSWLNRFRRLKIRYEHRADIHLAFLQLGCALISLRFLG